MAIKELGRVKTVVGNTQFELRAEANESFRIQNIHIHSPATSYATLTVDRLVVGYFRVDGNLGNHLPFEIQDDEVPTLFEFLKEMNIFRPIPVPTGMTFSIEGVHDADSVVCVVYDVYDANDVRSNEPNGIDSKQYDLIQYGRITGTAVAGDNLFNVQQTAGDFPGFPFTEVVPSNHTIRLHGLLFSDTVKASSTVTNQQRTDFIRMVQDRITLFDDDRQGFPYRGGTFVTGAISINLGQALGGNYSSKDKRPPLMFEEPLTFQSGSDLDLYVSTTVLTGSANLAASELEVGLIMTVDRKTS